DKSFRTRAESMAGNKASECESPQMKMSGARSPPRAPTRQSASSRTFRAGLSKQSPKGMGGARSPSSATARASNRPGGPRLAAPRRPVDAVPKGKGRGAFPIQRHGSGIEPARQAPARHDDSGKPHEKQRDDQGRHEEPAPPQHTVTLPEGSLDVFPREGRRQQ